MAQVGAISQLKLSPCDHVQMTLSKILVFQLLLMPHHLNANEDTA